MGGAAAGQGNGESPGPGIDDTKGKVAVGAGRGGSGRRVDRDGCATGRFIILRVGRTAQDLHGNAAAIDVTRDDSGAVIIAAAPTAAGEQDQEREREQETWNEFFS